MPNIHIAYTNCLILVRSSLMLNHSKIHFLGSTCTFIGIGLPWGRNEIAQTTLQ